MSNEKKILTKISEWELFYSFFWYPDGEKGDIRFRIDCNDVFCWGAADAELMTADDLDDMQKCIDKCLEVGELEDEGLILWISKKRNLRPQGAWFKGKTQELIKLFEEHTEKREVDFGNPLDMPLNSNE